MARRHLIEAYAGDLLDRLGGRATAIATEVLDHLAESVEQRIADGVSPDVAEREAVAAFGDVEVVAESFRATRVPMPTSDSGRAGVWLVRGAVLVMVSLSAMVAAQLVEWRQGWHTTPQVLGTIGCLALALALTSWVPGFHGLAHRVGAPASRVATASLLVGTGAIAALPAWFLWGWVTTLVTGIGLILPGVRRAGVGPRWVPSIVGLSALGAIGSSLVPVALGWPAGVVLASGLVRLGVALGLAVMAVGMFRMGRFLVHDSAPIALPEGVPLA